MGLQGKKHNKRKKRRTCSNHQTAICNLQTKQWCTFFCLPPPQSSPVHMKCKPTTWVSETMSSFFFLKKHPSACSSCGVWAGRCGVSSSFHMALSPLADYGWNSGLLQPSFKASPDIERCHCLDLSPITAGERSYQVQMYRKVGHRSKHVPDPILARIYRDPLIPPVHICTLAKSDHFLHLQK